MLTEKGASVAKGPRRMAPYLRAALSPYSLLLIPQTTFGTQQLTVASLASREVYHFCGPQDSILTGMCSVNSTSKYEQATRRPTPQAVSKSVTFL